MTDRTFDMSELTSVPRHVQRVILMGRPGAGKSCILNGLFGHRVFEAGIVVGKVRGGLTDKASFVCDANFCYIDIPGMELTVAKAREGDTKHVNEVLAIGGSFKVLFVMDYTGGRIDDAAIGTMRHVLHAMRACEISYGIILNKAPEEVMRAYQDPELLSELVDEFVFPGASRPCVAFQHYVDGARKFNHGNKSSIDVNPAITELIRICPPMHLPADTINVMNVTQSLDRKTEVLAKLARLNKLELEKQELADRLSADHQKAARNRYFLKRIGHGLLVTGAVVATGTAALVAAPVVMVASAAALGSAPLAVGAGMVGAAVTGAVVGKGLGNVTTGERKKADEELEKKLSEADRLKLRDKNREIAKLSKEIEDFKLLEG